jgi:hypothetical protein
VNRLARLHAACIAFALGCVTGVAAAEPLRVYVQTPPQAALDYGNRLFAELRSDGFAVESPPRSSASPCDTGNAPSPDLDAAWLELSFDAETNEIVTTLCYAAAGVLERASVRGDARDPKRLALATVEALNGLRARPNTIARPLQPPIRVRLPPPAAPAFNAVFSDAALAIEGAGGGPLVGVTLGLDAALRGPWSIAAEAFWPVRETEASAADRELSLGATWVRVGPRLELIATPLRLGVSAEAGPALVWASARATPPLLGTTERTAAAIFSGGLWLEVPSASPVYLRATGLVSRLVPSIELELGDGRVRSFGELLVETSIGAGVRWDAGLGSTVH